MSEVFDLDAVEAETQGDKAPFRFKFGGQQFTLPNYIDQRIMALDQRNRMPEAMELLFGAEQFARINGIPEVLDRKRWLALLGKWLEHLGSDLGESVASTDSSESTERPSKRTSSATTKPRSRRSSPVSSPGDASAS